MIALSLEELTPRISHGELRVYYGWGEKMQLFDFQHTISSMVMLFYMVMAN